MFQLTLCILKPDVVRSPRLFHVRIDKGNVFSSYHVKCSFLFSVQEIIELILQRQFIFVKSKRLQLNRERAGEFYREHQGLLRTNSFL